MSTQQSAMSNQLVEISVVSARESICFQCARMYVKEEVDVQLGIHKVPRLRPG